MSVQFSVVAASGQTDYKLKGKYMKKFDGKSSADFNLTRGTNHAARGTYFLYPASSNNRIFSCCLSDIHRYFGVIIPTKDKRSNKRIRITIEEIKGE